MIVPWIVCNFIIALFTFSAAIMEANWLWFCIAILLAYFHFCMCSLYKHLKHSTNKNSDVEYTAGSPNDWNVPQSNGNYDSSVQYVTKQNNPSPMCSV